MPNVAELACRECGYQMTCGPEAMLDWLRRVRMVRADVLPEPELLGELFHSAADRFQCPQCDVVGMLVRPIDDQLDDDEAWGMARRCESCSQPIARERLEALPDVRLCAACQAGDERGEAAGPREFCPRCGEVMTVRPARGAGIARYQMICPSCRR